MALGESSRISWKFIEYLSSNSQVNITDVYTILEACFYLLGDYHIMSTRD